jgi:hypothetical protein
MTPSRIGIQISWSCAHCSATAKTAQILTAGEPGAIAAPDGWTVYDGQVICGSHVVLKRNYIDEPPQPNSVVIAEYTPRGGPLELLREYVWRRVHPHLYQ